MTQEQPYDHIARIYGVAAAERWLHDQKADERRERAQNHRNVEHEGFVWDYRWPRLAATH